jgi:SAM-dependent methyltransferase
MNKRTRLPSILPAWLRERLDVNVYVLNRFMRKASSQLTARDRVLDAGAGDGRFKALFEHTRYVGVDLAVGDPEWDYSDLDAISNLERLPFPCNLFDAALCTQVLEHVKEPKQVLTEISRVLRPGGRLFLSAPQGWNQHQKPHDFFRYTSFGLRYLFERAGLQVESIQPMGGYFWFLSWQLQNINFWVFSHRKRTWLTWPIRLIFGIIFQVFFPLILFYLEPLDPVKDETFGYVCIGVKPA